MRLVIVGAGGHGKVAADCAKSTGRYSEIVFLDNNPEIHKVATWSVLGKPQQATDFINENTEFFVAIGTNKVRQQWQDQLEKQAATITSLIHPSACLGSGVKVAKGSLILAQAVINIDSQIGRGCIINTAATVDHDCLLGDFVHIAPGSHLAGAVQLGDRVFCGIGSAIVQCIHVGNDSIVGAGATVTTHLPGNETAVGTPARVLQKQ